ncbi:hypothetical protein [Agromyces bauzanensis]|uniref:hypothetical protein n=1 Tax=Agromyces bauzanensis TaxID=1308924 RepID=UPI0016681C06
MTARLRWGILAIGGIARLFTDDLLRNGFDVRAVGSRSIESARAFADERGIPNVGARSGCPRAPTSPR